MSFTLCTLGSILLFPVASFLGGLPYVAAVTRSTPSTAITKRFKSLFY